jgi:hypothetical protein
VAFLGFYAFDANLLDIAGARARVRACARAPGAQARGDRRRSRRGSSSESGVRVPLAAAVVSIAREEQPAPECWSPSTTTNIVSVAKTSLASENREAGVSELAEAGSAFVIRPAQIAPLLWRRRRRPQGSALTIATPHERHHPVVDASVDSLDGFCLL